MPLISLAAGLEHAREHRYALGAFNVLDSHFLRALFAAATQERSDRKSTRLNSSHVVESRMPSSA